MRTLRLPLVAAVSLCILLSGCHTGTQPRTVARYKPGGKPSLKEAKYWGEYRLYALEQGQRNPAPGAEPVATVRLAEDENFGFTRDTNGYVVATAADQRIPIQSKPHVWQMKPDEAQPDKTRRDLLVLGIFIGVVALGVIAVATADPFGN